MTRKTKERKKNKAIATQRKAQTTTKREKYITLKCKICSREIRVHVNPGNLDKYTPEVKKNHVCLNCR